MVLDARSCYRAVLARDRRFDGTFYVGVKTTGIYCRPVCPVRAPAESRCTFFGRAAEAERAGYRACLRCRPEVAPEIVHDVASVDAVGRLVRAATRHLDDGFLDERSVDDLADQLDVTARHLRRSMEREVGVTPIEYAQTRRLAMAKRLLHDTNLPLTEVAFASGFGSVRRFNRMFADRFGRAPSTLRRVVGGAGTSEAKIALRLDFRPPLAWSRILAFLEARAISGVEHVEGDAYLRSVAFGKARGEIRVERTSEATLTAHISVSLAPVLARIVARLRGLFDLDATPFAIDRQLATHRQLRKGVRGAPGLRVPGAFDPFELAVRAVLGQQVSVRGATTLCGRLVARFGQRFAASHAALAFTFPAAKTLARVDLEAMRAIGLPESRAKTILALASAVAAGKVDLEDRSAGDALLAIPGIGPWTVSYLGMRAFHDPDAFPSGDLAVQKALGVDTARAAERIAEPWRPWRAYATLHLWSSLTQGDSR